MSLQISSLGTLAWAQLWQVTAVAVAVWILVRLVGRKRPHLAYLLWLLVLVKAVTPPIWSSPAGVFSWAGLQVIGQPEAEPPPDAADTPRQEVLPGVAGDREPASAAEPERLGGTGILPVLSTGMGETPVPPALPTVATVLAIVWLCGAAGYLAIAARRRLTWGLALRRSGPAGENLEALVADLSRRLATKKNVRVRATSEPLGPLVVGVFRPVILLPETLVTNKSPADLEPILAHELIHVRRGDAAVGLLQVLVQALWWFNPLVWWANRSVCHHRERCCDAEVVTGLSCARERYAQSLLDVLKLERHLVPLPAMPGMSPYQVTLARLESVMDPQSPLPRFTPRRFWLCFAAGLILLLPGAGLIFDRGDNAAAHAPVPPGGPQGTIHWRFVGVRPTGRGFGTKPHTFTEETWLDMTNGRLCRQWRASQPKGDSAGESIFDGEYWMLADNQQGEKVVFLRLRPVQRELLRRYHQGELLKRMWVGDPKQNERFSRVGQEKLLGAPHDVWVGTAVRMARRSTAQVKAWLRADTGELSRLELRSELDGEVASETYEVIERNAPIPAERFAMKPPAGYTLVNTKETARNNKSGWAGFGHSGRGELFAVHFAFTWTDGTVLLCWTSKYDQPATHLGFLGKIESAYNRLLAPGQAKLLRGLKPGDPLPEHPSGDVLVETITPDDKRIEYVGRHLTSTVDDGGFCAWSMHVPREKVPPRSQLPGYLITYWRDKVSEDGKEWRTLGRTGEIRSDIPIGSAQDYSFFVVGAMREYETKQPGRKFPTYDEVLQLAAKVRESLAGKP